MSNLYFFVLGNHPILSLAEIFALFGEKVKLRSFSGNFAVFEFASEPNLPEDFQSLGGSIKFGKIIKESIKNIEEDILFELCRQTKENKVFFGISVYGKIKLRVKNLGMAVKKRIGENGRSARFVVSREDALSSVVVKTNKLLSGRGAEFVVLGDGKTNFLGKTLAVQEFEEYEKRDYGRPSRDMLRGMLPPKLAKIMINLAGTPPHQLDDDVKNDSASLFKFKKDAATPKEATANWRGGRPKDGVILDPFCGTGTILSEAAILGYKNLIGSDNDPEAIKSAEENLNWLKNDYQLSTNNYQLFVCDAKEISKKVGEKSIDAIIAEPYLGPPMRGNESPEKINQLINLLKNLYLESFQEFKKILKPDGRVVFVLPIFRPPPTSPFPRKGEAGWGMDLKKEIEKIGFEIINPLPPEIKIQLNSQFGPNGGLVYGRENQMIWREIVVLELAH